MRITRKLRVRPMPLQRLAADAPSRLTNALWQNSRDDRGSDQRGAGNYRKSLINWSFRFVIGGLRQVELRNHGD